MVDHPRLPQEVFDVKFFLRKNLFLSGVVSSIRREPATGHEPLSCPEDASQATRGLLLNRKIEIGYGVRLVPQGEMPPLLWVRFKSVLAHEGLQEHPMRTVNGRDQ